MTAAPIHTSSNPGTAHLPLPRQPSMHERIKRQERKRAWCRANGNQHLAIAGKQETRV